MKIAIVCYPTFGGSGVVATELGLELAKKENEIHFITYRQPVRLEQLKPNIFYHEVNVTEYPLFHYQPYELALSSKIVDIIRHHKIDVLHVHYAIPHAYAGYMAKKMLEEQNIRIPMVTTLHGTDITLVGKHPNYKNAVMFSINNSDVITSVSESLKSETNKIFNIRKEIHVVPNFIDFSRDDYKEDRKCVRNIIAQEGERIITHISNFRPIKRIPDVIDIFYKIQQKIPSKLLMVGNGDEKEKAEIQCKELGISDRVIFFGNTPEINRILCSSDLLLLPSQIESFGLAALEAMALGVPVISTNTGGLPEVNKNGISGYLSNVGNTEEMAKNAIKILSDDITLKTFKKNAKKEALRFDISKVIPLYQNLYNQILEIYTK